VLATGLAFGLSGVRPVPVIVLAQALNGVLLPGVAIFLLIAVNDRRLMGSRGLNGWLSNAAMVVVTLVALQLGLLAIARVVAGLAGADEPGLGLLAGVAGGSAALLAIPVARLLRRVRGGEMDERMIA
jgi:hypothetical protein